MAKSKDAAVESVARDPKRDDLPRGAANPLPPVIETTAIDPVVLDAAKRGYLAYAAHHGFRDPRDARPMEPWENRTKHEQDGFYNAALAILTRPVMGTLPVFPPEPDPEPEARK